MKADLVLTTINNPTLLYGYYENFVKYDNLENIRVVVIPDRKTPKEAYDTCIDLKNKGLDVNFIDLEDQENYLKKFYGLNKIIPYNSDNRRNVGYLMAYDSNSDFLITIDDDNYSIIDEDYFKEHLVVCSANKKVDVVKSDNGWYNICQLMNIEPQIEVYARGFPYNQRHKKPVIKEAPEEGKVTINAGLWSGEPDLDGITWLTIPVRTSKLKDKSIYLSNTTWSPINTQNTSLAKEVIPSYYFVKMGYPLMGARIDRYGDIFSGYFSQKCAKELGDIIRVGTPVAEHKRNSHNYLNDATNELACIWILEDLLPWLREVKLEGNSYSEYYESLSYKIEDFAESIENKFWAEDVKGYMHQMAYNMRLWLKACSTIHG